MVTLFLAAAAAIGIQGAFALSCLDNDGNPVDWFLTYKLPGGYDIAYFDSTSPKPSPYKILPLYQRSLDDEQDPVALIRTLRSLLPSSEKFGAQEGSDAGTYVMYNDQPDNYTPSNSYGHTKGVLGYSPTGSFWILHSTPHFPAASDNPDFYFPEKEIIYGQTFLCMSLNSNAEVEQIANNFRLTHPYVYFNNMPESALAELPNLSQVLNKNWLYPSQGNLETFQVGSESMHYFAKNKNWNDDLWENLVAPGIGSNLLVESWLRGLKEGSYCQPEYKFTVLDVKSVSACCGPHGNITWLETQDHAKWAVPLDQSGWLCIGDINRMTSQRKRGGGAVCFKYLELSEVLFNSVVDSFSCSGTANQTVV